VFFFSAILYATNGKIKSVGSVKVNSLKIKGSRQNTNTIGITPEVGKMSTDNPQPTV
jgi:hypothetical protein